MNLDETKDKCSGCPKICEYPGCDIMHPNGIEADSSLRGWICYQHDQVYLINEFTKLVKKVLENSLSLELIEDTLELAVKKLSQKRLDERRTDLTTAERREKATAEFIAIFNRYKS